MPSGGNIRFNVGFQVDKTGLNEITKSLQQVQAQASKMSSSNQLKSQFNEAAAAAKQLESIVSGAWNDKLGQLNLDKLNQSIKNSYGGVQQLRTKLTQAGSSGNAAFNNLAHSVLNTNLQLIQSNKLLDDMATSMANTVKWGITSSIFNNITSSIQSAYYYAKDLDRSLNNIRIVTGDSAEQMERFAKAANETAKDLGRSTLDYTKAATSFYQQGLNDEEVQARTQVALKAQNITGAGSEILDQLTAVWNGFQIGTDGAEQAVDKLAAVADNSASDMSELATAMSKVAATANVMGVDIDQLTAQLATVIATTRQAPESVGTAFKTIYTRLNDIKTGADGAEVSLGKYSGAMAELGFNVLDASGNLRDTGQVMEQIGGRWDSLTKEQQVYLAQTMGGQRQITQIMALFDNWGVYVDNLNTSLASQGTLNQKNNIYLESTAAHLQRLGTESERTADLLFDQNTVNGFVDALNKGLTVFNDYIEGIGGGTTAFVNFGAAVANVFSNQIGKAITTQIQNFKILRQNAEAFKAQGSFSQAVLNNVETQHQAQGQVVSDAALQKQVAIAQKTLQVRKALTQEQYNELMQMQQKVGVAQTEIDRLEQYRKILQDNKISEQASVQVIQDNLNAKQQELDLQKAIADYMQLSLIPSDKLTQSQRDRITAAEDILLTEGDQAGILVGISAKQQEIIEKLQTEVLSDEQIRALLKQQNDLINTQQQVVGKLTQAVEGKKAAEDGTTQKLKEQQAARQRIIQQQQEQAAKQMVIQKAVRIASSTVQGLTALVGGLSTAFDESSTSAEKMNGWFSAISGTAAGLANAFMPGSGFLVQGIAGLVKTIAEATGIWDTIENSIKTTTERVQDLKETIKSVNDINKTEGGKISSLESIVDEYEKLSQKAGAYGVNLDKLTLDEQNRYHQLTNEFSQYNEAVIAGYDEQGNAIVRGQDALLDTIQVLKQAKKEAASAAIGDVDTYLENLQAKQDEKRSITEKNIEDATDRKKMAQDQLNRFTGQNGGGDLIDIFNYAQDQFQAEFQEQLSKVAPEKQQKIRTALAQYWAQYYKILSETNIYEPAEAAKKMKSITANAEIIISILNKNLDIPTSVFDDFINSFKQSTRDQIEKVVRTQDQVISQLETKLKQNEEENLDRDTAIGILNIIQSSIGYSDEWDKLIDQADKVGISVNTITDILLKHMQTFKNSTDPKEILSDTQQYEIILANALAENQNNINQILKSINSEDFEGTAKEKNNQIKKALTSIFDTNTFKELPQQTKQAFQDLIASLFNLSDIQVDFNTGEVTDFTTQTINALQNAINAAIGTEDSQQKQSLTQQITDYLIGHFDEEKVNEITAAMNSAASGSFQTFNEFLRWMHQYNQEMKQLAADQQEGIVIQKIDKITGAINKLQSGKDLKYSEKQQFVTDGILTQEELKGLSTRTDWLEILMSKINNLEDDGQRREYIASLFKDIDSLNKALEDNLIDPEDYNAVWNTVFENEIEALDLTISDLQHYAEVKKIAFDPNNEDSKQAVLNLYKQQQQVKSLKDTYEKLEDVKLKDGQLPEDLKELWNLLQSITGENISYDWLLNNFQTLGKILKNSSLSAEELNEKIKLLVSGKGNILDFGEIDPEKSLIELKNIQIIRDVLENNKELTKEESDILDTLQGKYQNLAKLAQDKGRYSKEYLFYLEKEQQIQQRVTSIQLKNNEEIIKREQELNQLRKQRQQAESNIDRKEFDDTIIEKQKQLNDLKREQFTIEQNIRELMESIQLDSDVDQEKWINLTEYLQEVADNIVGISDELKENQQGAAEFAEELLRYDSALETILEKWDEWNQVIENWQETLGEGNENLAQAAELTEQLSNVYSDLLDLPYENLSEGFLTSAENLDLLKQAAYGSEQAYDRLRQLALEDLVINAGLNMEDFYTEQGQFYDEYNQIVNDLSDIEVGAELNFDTTQALANLAQALYEMGMGTAQIESMFATMGANVTLTTGASAEELKNQGYIVADEISNTAARVKDEVTQIAGQAAENVIESEESTSTEAQVSTEEQPIETEHQITGYSPEITPIPLRYMGKRKVGDDENLSWEDVPAEGFYPKVTIRQEPPTILKDHKKASGTAIAITNKPTKQGGGGVKFRNTSHGAGSPGVTTRTPPATTSSKPSSYRPSSSKPSSSKPSTSKPSTSSSNKPVTEKPEKVAEPDHMDPLEEEADRYHDIDIQLKKIQTDLKRLQDLEDKFTGQKLIKNLNKQLEILKDQVKAYEKKLSIARVEAQEIRKTLQKQGVNFNNQGQIANYEFILQQKLNNLNATISHYNLLSKEEQQGYKATVQAAKKEYEEFKKKIERYDQLTTSLIPGLQDSITEAIDQQFEIQIQKFKINVELMLDTSQAERDFNKFRKKVIDKLRKDNILGNTRALFNDYGSYYKDGFDVIESLTDQVNNTLYEIDQIKKRGKSDVYGNNQAAAEQDLKKYTKELMDSLEDVEDIVQDIKDSIFDAIDAAQDAFDLQIDRLEYIDDLIGHGQKLTELLYGDDAYEQMNHFFELQTQNNKKELDFARRQRDMWERKVQSQRQRMLELDPKSNAFKQAEDRLKEYQKHLKDASQNFNDYLQTTIENIINKYTNAIDAIFNELQKKVSNGKGLDYISEEWQLMNKQADMYLDTINSAFEINKIEQAFKEAIANNEGDLKAQQSLNNLMKEQLDYLKGKDKLTKYEVDRANALLQIEIQRLALENTRANKSKLRLRRDSQGNYTYQYVEDVEETKEAQDKLQQAQNNLYNMSKDAYLKNQEQFLKIFQEWEDKVKKIYEDTTLTVEEQKEKQALLNQYYGQIINNLMDNDAMYRKFLMEDTFTNLADMYNTDINNFKEMSDAEQNILMQELIPQWDSGIGQMIDTFTGAGGFIPVVEESFGDLGQAVQTLEEELDEVESIAGVDFDNINTYIEDAMQLTEELIADNGYLVDSYEENINAVQSLIDEIERLTDTYREAESAAIAAVSAANGFLQVTPTSNYSSSGAVDLDELVPTYEGVSSSSSSSSGYTPPSTPAPAPASAPAVDLDSMAPASNTGHSGSSSRPLDSSTIEGIAAAIWLDDGGWGVDPGRRAKLTEKFGADGAAKVQSYINQQAANGFSYLTNKYWNEQGEYGGGLRNYYYSAFKTGGYTGSWGNTGKLAVLHEKELVLNKEDTRNILSAVNIVKTMDDLLSSIGTNLNNSNNILSNLSSFGNNNHSVLDQNVHITATFPAVNSRAEIEDALSGLVNRASQYAYSNKK